MSSVQTGLERFIKTPPEWVLGERLGLLSNPASVDRQLSHARDLINIHFPGQLKALYSPQHGFFAEKQDNMIESDDITEPILQIPVFSLYGQTRKPTKEMLDPIDVLIIDLQDAGTRVYTFIYTMSYCLEAFQMPFQVSGQLAPLPAYFIEYVVISDWMENDGIIQRRIGGKITVVKCCVS